MRRDVPQSEAAATRQDAPLSDRVPLDAEAWASFSALLVRERDPDRLCEEVCRLLVDRFGFSRALVATRSRDGGRLVTRAGYDPSIPTAVARALAELFTIPLQPRDDGRHLVAAWCVLEDEQVHVPDAAAYDFRPDRTVQRPTLVEVFGTREYVLTPVRGPGGVLGLLGTDRNEGRLGIDARDRQILRAAGDSLGLALEARGWKPVSESAVEPHAPTEPPPDRVRRPAQNLSELLDVLREGLVLVAPEGEVRYLNRAAASLLGVLPWDAVGRPVSALFPARLESASALAASARAEETPRHGSSWRFEAAGGGVVEVQEEVLGASLPGLRGWRAIFLVDVTERVEEERSRDEFLALLVHDLSAPLQGIVGFAELLLMGRAGELSETQRDFVERIEESGWEVGSLVDDIRVLTQLRTGSAHLSLERVDPFLLVQEALERLRGERAPGPIFVNDVPPDLPAAAADRARLESAIVSLCRAAAEACGPEDQVRLWGDAGRGEWIRLHVGGPIGDLGEEDARRVLRGGGLWGGRSSRRSALGLLVARAVVRVLGGQVSVSSAPDGQTVVSITLPTSGPA